MTDFNNFNPDKGLHIGFNAKRHGKGPQAESQQPQGAEKPAVDPYADQKTSPDKMLNLMAAQGKMNMPPIENAGIERSIGAFMKECPPERHAAVAKQMTQAYTDETGKAPAPALVQEMVDNYLIGSPVVAQTP